MNRGKKQSQEAYNIREATTYSMANGRISVTVYTWSRRSQKMGELRAEEVGGGGREVENIFVLSFKTGG
jgi:hypothetical protein